MAGLRSATGTHFECMLVPVRLLSAVFVEFVTVSLRETVLNANRAKFYMYTGSKLGWKTLSSLGVSRIVSLENLATI